VPGAAQATGPASLFLTYKSVTKPLTITVPVA
jgi:hypothetical protein